MTRNNPFEKAARAYQQAHPELTYQQAKRAVAYNKLSVRESWWGTG